MTAVLCGMQILKDTLPVVDTIFVIDVRHTKYISKMWMHVVQQTASNVKIDVIACRFELN